MTIALIEDDEAVLHSLRLLLESHGMKVRTFESAEAFLASDSDWAPACVVSDVRLPGLSGLDLHRRLKAKGTAPVILITGHGDIPMAVNAIKEGAFDFIEKPYDAEQLMATIEKALAAGEKLRDTGNPCAHSRTIPAPARGHAPRGQGPLQQGDRTPAWHQSTNGGEL
jgi:two-component system response regulator FixJ